MNWTILPNGIGPASHFEIAGLDVLRTVTETLCDVDFEPTLLHVGYFPIHSISTARVKFESQGADIGPFDQRLFQGVPVDRPPFHCESVWIDCLNKAGLSDQHRRPRSTGLVRCADQ